MFLNSKGETIEKIEGKGENGGKQAFSPFLTIYFTFLITNFNFGVMFLQSANAFNFDTSQIFCFKKQYKRTTMVLNRSLEYYKVKVNNEEKIPNTKVQGKIIH